MKTSVLSVALGLASVACAVPTSMMQAEVHTGTAVTTGLNARQFGGIFGQGDNIFSNIFDGAACIVSSFIGGGNPRCQGRGEAVVKTDNGKPNSNNGGNQGSKYTFKYTTNPDETLKVTIDLEGGRSCTYDLAADGKPIMDVIKKAADKCVAEK